MNKSNKNRILVVEDERHIAFGIKFNLEAEGFVVMVAADGPTALQMIADEQPAFDLIILDLMLPGMSGYAVCRRLRDANNHTPILILSARSLSEDRTLGFDAGANQYLTKPFDLNELLSRVRNLLKLHERGTTHVAESIPSGKVFTFGDAEIDFATYEARVRGKTTRLTALQLRLLEYFIEHQGRVVTRQELLENVWDLPAYMNTRAPDQFMRQLRKTFEAEPSQPQHFITVRDVGYRFLPEQGAVD